MYDCLFEKVFNWINYQKYYIKPGFMHDKILYRKTSQKFILDKFLHKWLDNLSINPIDIIDGMLLKYYQWSDNAKQEKNNILLTEYDIYIKTLIDLKNYISSNMI